MRHIQSRNQMTIFGSTLRLELFLLVTSDKYLEERQEGKQKGKRIILSIVCDILIGPGIFNLPHEERSMRSLLVCSRIFFRNLE